MITKFEKYWNKKYEAYPGDENIPLHKSEERQSSTLSKVAIICIVVCGLVDFINIGDLMQLAYDIPTEVIKNPFLNLSAYFKPMFFTILLTASIALSSIFFGALYRGMHNSAYNIVCKIGFIVLMCFIITEAIAITVFRISAEYISAGGDVSTLSYDPLILSCVYSACMFTGIVVSLLYGMFGKNLLKEEFTKSEKQKVSDDKNIYRETKERFIKTKLEAINYYEKKRDLGLKMVKVFKDVELMSAKLKCISDPADIQDIDTAFAKFGGNLNV